MVYLGPIDAAEQSLRYAYTGEVVELKWKNVVDGCLIAYRQKKGRHIRVCVLWKETLEAIKALPRINDHIFTTRYKATLRPSGSHDASEELAKAAKVKVTGSQLRDGAARAVARNNISTINLNILMGHSCSIEDKYVLRDPKMVTDACKAIYKDYMAM
jgi:integrase